SRRARGIEGATRTACYEDRLASRPAGLRTEDWGQQKTEVLPVRRGGNPTSSEKQKPGAASPQPPVKNGRGKLGESTEADLAASQTLERVDRVHTKDHLAELAIGGVLNRLLSWAPVELHFRADDQVRAGLVVQASRDFVERSHLLVDLIALPPFRTRTPLPAVIDGVEQVVVPAIAQSVVRAVVCIGIGSEQVALPNVFPLLAQRAVNHDPVR